MATPTMKEIVLKVSMPSQKCKQELMMLVSTCGVDSVSADVEKGTLTVKGEVDPVLVVRKLKRAVKKVEIISIGTPKPPCPRKPPGPPASSCSIL